MDPKLPTTKYSPKYIVPRKPKIRDPYMAVNQIKLRTKDIHPIFHHARMFVRVVVASAFVVSSAYFISSPESASRAKNSVVAFVNNIVPVQALSASVANIFR